MKKLILLSFLSCMVNGFAVASEHGVRPLVQNVATVLFIGCFSKLIGSALNKIEGFYKIPDYLKIADGSTDSDFSRSRSYLKAYAWIGIGLEMFMAQRVKYIFRVYLASEFLMCCGLWYRSAKVYKELMKKRKDGQNNVGHQVVNKDYTEMTKCLICQNQLFSEDQAKSVMKTSCCAELMCLECYEMLNNSSLGLDRCAYCRSDNVGYQEIDKSTIVLKDAVKN